METGAEYALDTENYDFFVSWNRVIEKQFGEFAPAMKVFASHSQHMENSLVKCEPPDAPEFYTAGHEQF